MPFNSLSNKLKTLKMTPGLNQPRQGYPAIGGMRPQNNPKVLDDKQLAFMKGRHQGNPMGRDTGMNPAGLPKPPFLEDQPKPLFPGGQFPKIGVPDVKTQPVLPQQTRPSLPSLPGSMTVSGQPWTFPGGKPPRHGGDPVTPTGGRFGPDTKTPIPTTSQPAQAPSKPPYPPHC